MLVLIRITFQLLAASGNRPYLEQQTSGFGFRGKISCFRAIGRIVLTAGGLTYGQAPPIHIKIYHPFEKVNTITKHHQTSPNLLSNFNKHQTQLQGNTLLSYELSPLLYSIPHFYARHLCHRLDRTNTLQTPSSNLVTLNKHPHKHPLTTLLRWQPPPDPANPPLVPI